jgi:hypothetical protein
MLGLNPYALAAKAAALVAALLLGFAGGWRVEAGRWASAELAAAQARNAALATQAKRENYAAAALETKKESQRVVYRTIYKQADAWVAERPPAACLDADGVRIVNAALGGHDADRAQPDGAVQPGDAARRWVARFGAAQAGGGGPAPQ